MDVRLLGAMEVVGDDGSPVVVGPTKRWVVLAMLALSPGRFVSTDQLIEAVWGEEPPRSALATLRGLVFELRKTIGSELIESGAAGYRLMVGRSDVDATRFEDAATSGENLTVALSWWSGTALDGLGDSLLVVAQRQRLEMLRLSVVERWADEALAVGRNDEVIHIVERELMAAKWRESLWARLITALYRANRQADALAAYGRARRQLADDLGLEPGLELQALERQILLHDPALQSSNDTTEPPLELMKAPRATVGNGAKLEPKKRSRRWLRPTMFAGTAVVLVAVGTIVIVASRGSGSASSSKPLATEAVSTASTVATASSVGGSAATSSPATETTLNSSAAGAKVTAPTSYSPTLKSRDCAADAYARTVSGVECWSLTVPEDRTDPARKTIELSGYKILAKSNPATAPTVIDLGPSNVIDNDPLSEVANIVLFPSRGWLWTTPSFSCPEVYDVAVAGLAQPSGDPTIASQKLDAFRNCREQLINDGVDLASYNMEAEISDVTDYLSAAGLDAVFMTAASLDSPAVLVAADRFPGTFRGIFLDDPIDPGTSALVDPPRDLQAAFLRLVKLCLADPICSVSHPNLPADATATWNGLNQSPQLVKASGFGAPLRQGAPVSATKAFDVLVDGGRWTETLLAAMYIESTFGLIPKSLDGGAAFLDVAGTLPVYLELNESRVGPVFQSYDCASRRPDIPSPAINALPEYVVAWYIEASDRCKVWNVPKLGPQFFAPSNGPTPTFIAVGELAPIPAIEWAVGLQRTRPNTTIISFATLGDTIATDAPGCYQKLLQTFVLDPNAELETASCEAQSPVIKFA